MRVLLLIGVIVALWLVLKRTGQSATAAPQPEHYDPIPEPPYPDDGSPDYDGVVTIMGEDYPYKGQDALSALAQMAWSQAGITLMDPNTGIEVPLVSARIR